MPSLLTQSLLTGIITFLSVLLLIALGNSLTLRRLPSYAHAGDWPAVSILLPARNEALSLQACALSLLAQDYPDFEVMVLDDDSTDATPGILHELAARHERLRVLKGRPLPAGWLGKHWACHQLAEAARGEMWVFTDADTLHHPRTLREAVAALLIERADLITAIPHQELGSWGERLIVPLLPWSLFSFYPLWLAERRPWPPLVMAVGQFMLFRREAYKHAGGHAAVRADVADDIALARRLVAQGGCWRMLDAGGRVSCRMYRSFDAAQHGFSKNLLAAFGYNVPLLIAVWLWLGIVFLAPPVLLIAACAPALPITTIGLALCLWWLNIRRFRLPPVLLLLYPVTVCLGLFIALHSVMLTLTGQARWKDRLIPAPP